MLFIEKRKFGVWGGRKSFGGKIMNFILLRCLRDS